MTGNESRRARAALTIAAISLALLISAPSPPAVARAHYATGAACGVELWAKKTLSDSSVGRISLQPRLTTITWLVRQRAPADADANLGRLAPIETTIWRIKAQLVGYRLEPDGDMHLVLRDPGSRAEMIGEIPAPYCVAKNGALYAALRRRVGKIGHHRATRRWWWLDYRGATPPIVTIEGVGFFDRLHDQDGMAPNGVELHPLLDIDH